jgi:diaminopimelate epimerase
MKKTLIPLHFTKMHGLGNDFVVVHDLQHTLDTCELPITRLADRHLGIGFDQLLVIGASQQADFSCRIFNADGSEAEQCGNGLRCVGRYIHEEQLHPQPTFCLETKGGIFPLSVQNYDSICMTISLSPIQTIPTCTFELALDSHTAPLSFTLISMGNPHAIANVTHVDTVPVTRWGKGIAAHPQCQSGVNVGFMEVMDRARIRLRTYERGVGETHACGSNACAATIVGMVHDHLDHAVQVEYRYGSLWIQWEEKTHSLRMIGPASRVFSGTLLL